MPRRSKSSTIQLWQERLERFERSDKTVKDFCAQEGVSYASFYSWRKRLRSNKTNANLPAFQPLHITSQATPILVELPNGLRLHLAADLLPSAHSLIELLARLPLDTER